VSDRKDDPAFIYFPTNYRWSMGLLLNVGQNRPIVMAREAFEF